MVKRPLTVCLSINNRNCSLPGCRLKLTPRPDRTSFAVGSIILLGYAALDVSFIGSWLRCDHGQTAVKQAKRELVVVDNGEAAR